MKPRAAKKVVYAGRGPPPDIIDGAKAIFDYQAQLLPDDFVPYQEISPSQLPVIDDTRKKWPDGYGEPLEIVFGKKFQLPIWEECLKTMRIDEFVSDRYV